MLCELSMVLFMKDNAHMIDGIVEYHAQTRVNMYILHDAETAHFPQEIHEKYDHVHYYHFHNSTILERFHFIQNKITTEYFVFRSDRRHPTNTSLIRSVEFLKNNSEYSSVSGIWLFEDKTPTYMIELLSKSGEHDDVITRIQDSMLASQPHFYNVHRTSIMKAYIESQLKIDSVTTNIYFSEYVHKFILSFIGKTRSMHFLSGIIQDKNEHSSYYKESFDVPAILQNTSMTTEIGIIIKNILNKYNFKTERIEQALETWYETYLIILNILRSNIDHLNSGNVRTFTFMESLYHEMNTSTIPPELLQKYLKGYMFNSFSRNIKYQYVQHFFNEDDMDEMLTIMQLIAHYEKLEQLFKFKNINAQFKKIHLHNNSR